VRADIACFPVPPSAQASRAASDREGEARLALRTLAGTLATVYGIAALTLPGPWRALTMVLVAVAAIQALLALAGGRLPAPALALAGAADAALLAAWVVTRTRGLPVGALDSLCALDAALAALLAVSLARGGAQRTGPAVQVALLLAVVTLSLQLGGHTHATDARGPWSQVERLTGGVAEGGGAGGEHFLCRLL
jgi:hypothetical protein